MARAHGRGRLALCEQVCGSLQAQLATLNALVQATRRGREREHRGALRTVQAAERGLPSKGREAPDGAAGSGSLHPSLGQTPSVQSRPRTPTGSRRALQMPSVTAFRVMEVRRCVTDRGRVLLLAGVVLLEESDRAPSGAAHRALGVRFRAQRPTLSPASRVSTLFELVRPSQRGGDDTARTAVSGPGPVAMSADASRGDGTTRASTAMADISVTIRGLISRELSARPAACPIASTR